jgi:hypothetical protein
LSDAHPVWVSFTWTPVWQREIVLKAFDAAATRIDKAHYAIHRLLDETKKQATIELSAPSPKEKPLHVLSRQYKFFEKNLDFYTKEIDKIYNILHSRDGEIPIWSTNWKGLRNKEDKLYPHTGSQFSEITATLTGLGEITCPEHVMANCKRFSLGTAPNAGIEQQLHAADSILRGAIRSWPTMRRA